MSTMVWDEAGTRYYETGVSRGIYFPMNGPAVPWNGLVSIGIDPSGGELEAYYHDGVKYFDSINAEDFQATIVAISTPKEFAAAEGIKEVKPGMHTYFNNRAKFNLCWRTEIGNDVDERAGYKLHMAYNCRVQPASRAYATISDSASMDSRSFVITTTPACGKDSYYTFDSRELDLTELEALLYVGTLPKCWELKALVNAPDAPPSDDDCPALLVDFGSYNPGEVVSESTISDDEVYEIQIYGKINNGLDITELPATGAFAANDSAASEVGTGDILADDDDATYITSADGDLGYTVMLPSLVGYVEGCRFELHIRMSISGDVSEDDPDNIDADAQVHISTDSGGDTRVGGFSDGTDEGMGFALTAVDGSIVDYVVPLSMDAWVDKSITDVVTALEAGAYLNIVGASNNNFDSTPEVRVYEASVVMLNDTDPDKWLRSPAPDDNNGRTTLIIHDEDGSALVKPHSTYVDFKIMEVEWSTDADGDVSDVATYVDSTGGEPGMLRVEMDTGIVKVKLYDTTGGSVLTTINPTIDTWYQARIDFGYSDAQVRVYPRESIGTLLIDETIDVSSLDPMIWVKFYAKFVGDGDKTYEVGVDNERIQVHCNVEGPDLEPFTLDLPAWYCNDVGGAPFADVDRFTTLDDSGDYDIGVGDRIGVGYFAESDHGAVVSGTWIYMPDTPDGYTIARATYVARAYRESDGGTYTGSAFSGYTPGTNLTNPYLNAESSGTSNNYAINLPVGSFDEVEWSGDEVLTRLTNPPGSQLPCLRLWNESSQSPFTIHSHVSYYAVRLYYEPI